MRLFHCLFSVLLAFAWAGIFHTQAAEATLVNRFQAQTFSAESGGTLPYRLFTPAPAAPQRKLPLVILLHGTSGRGTDNAGQFTGGSALGATFFSSAKNQEQFPCMVLVPQCPPDDQWARTDYRSDRYDQPPDPGPTMRLLIGLIRSTISGLPVDADRIYVVGNSMGGYGAWDLVTRETEAFAAVVPICGGGDVSRAAGLAPLPVWIFHGETDPIVDVGHSRRMVAALRQAGGKPRYTEYAGVGHDIANRVYQEAGLAQWLFAQKRRGKP